MQDFPESGGSQKSPPAKINGVTYRALFIQLFKKYFLPDGVEFIASQKTFGVVYPNQPTEIKTDTSEFWMYVVAFLGLPSRPKGFKDADNNFVPHLTFWQFCRNLIGGFDWAENTSSLKKFLQFIGMIPIKLCLILPFKVFTFPFKLTLNVFKLLTLVIFPLLVQIKEDIVNLIHLGLALLSLKIPIPLNIIVIAVIWSISFTNLLLNLTTSLLLTIVVIALNPLLSTKDTYDSISESLHPIFGFVFALINLGIALATWAIVIPILISAVITLFPAVVGYVTFVAHLPVIASVLTALSGTFLYLTPIGAFFAPWATSVAGLFGITLSTTLISVVGASTISFCALIIAVPACYIADALSNRWAAWHEGGIINAFFGPAPKLYIKEIMIVDSDTSAPTKSQKRVRRSSQPSRQAQNFGQGKASAFGAADDADWGAASTEQRASTGDPELDDIVRRFQQFQQSRNAGKKNTGKGWVEVVDDDQTASHDFK